jgi:cytochrome b561
MKIKRQSIRFDWPTILLHWIIAVLVFSLFFIGVWMVELGYYDPWYHRAPWWHKSLGVVVLGLLIFRWLWQFSHPKVVSLLTKGSWQEGLSCWVHSLMNILVVLIGVSGYFIVTAKGQHLSLFDWFSIPALLQELDNLEDWAGEVHYYLAYTLMGLVILHILAALKHHFIDKDAVLNRMLGRK